jgi:magnesium chelatase family protein
MPRVPPLEVVGPATPEPSAVVAARIAAARHRQQGRQGLLNGRLRGGALRRACRLTAAGIAHAARLAELDAQTARGTERLLRVARTIADLDDAATVHPEHLDEAVRYRGPASRLERALAV